MSSIYITSKKRVNSSLLWVVASIVIISTLGIVYIFVNPMLTAKVKDGSSSNITSSSESTPPVSEQLSRPVNEIMMNPSDSTKDNADKVLPAMPAPDKAESGDIEMPKKDPSDKPSLTMEELIEQSK